MLMLADLCTKRHRPKFLLVLVYVVILWTLCRQLFTSLLLPHTVKRFEDYSVDVDYYHHELSQIYIESFHKLDRELSFVHIPKTGGSTIEKVSRSQARMVWGVCMFYKYHPNCKPPPRLRPGQKGDIGVSCWHIPPFFWPLGGDLRYQSVDLFAVTRHPYDRLLSEYYYDCYYHARPCSSFNRTLVNNDLKHKLARDLNYTKDLEAYFRDDGHYIPQYDYIVGPRNVRMVDYVLQLETIATQQFPRLTRAYGLNMSMVGERVNAGERTNNKLSSKDIDDSVRERMQILYHADFGLNNYSFRN